MEPFYDDSGQAGIDGLAEGGFGAGFMLQVDGRVETFALGELLQLDFVLDQVHHHRNGTADGAEGSNEEGLKFFMFLSVFICVLCGWIGVGDAFDAEFGVFRSL